MRNDELSDPHDLRRFLVAQASVYTAVCSELRRGKKSSHWMWFIFPQVAGLGGSDMAEEYAIASRAEALAYLAHPTLGTRLRKCTRLVNEVQGRSLLEIFGEPDDMKFRSSMTLFAAVARGSDEPFAEALEKYCGAQPDPKTLELLD
jgi:uncharacterized protein (DUF1810 family)